MNLSAIFSKTGKGVQEASGKTSQLSRGDRAVLSAIDGKTPLSEVQSKFEKLAGPKFEALIQQLDKDGFIREVSSGQAAPARPAAPAAKAPPPAAKTPPPADDSSDGLDFTQAIKIPSRAPAPAAPKPPPVDFAAAARADAERKAKEQQAIDYKTRQEAEAKAKAEAELKAKAAAEARARADAESRARAAAEAKAREAAEAKGRADAEARARAEAEAKARADADAKTHAEAEAKVKAAREAAVRMATEAKAKAEADAKAKADAAERDKARLEAELNAKLDVERKAREEAERRAAEATDKARKDLEEKVKRDEEEMRRRLEAEMKAQLDAERKAREEEDRKRREEEDRRRKEEDERRAKEEAERRAKEEAERKKREEEDRRRREEDERRRKEEDERRAKEEAERKKREEDDARRVKEEAERKAKDDAERKAKDDAERRALEDTNRKLDADRRAKEEAERKVKEEAERKARDDAERKAKDDAERRAKEESDARARAAAAAAVTLPKIEAVVPPPPPAAAAPAASIGDDLLADLDSFGKREEEEQKEREETERKAKEEKARKEKEDAERRAKEEADKKRREEEERRRKEDEERRAAEEAERKAKEEEEQRKQEEAERKRKAKEALAAKQAAERAKATGKVAAKKAGDEDIDVSDEDLDADDLKGDQKVAAEKARRVARESPPLVVATGRPRKWGKPVAIALFVLLIAGVGVLHVMPIATAEYEKAASDAMGVPVRIGSARLSLISGIEVKFEGVSVGSAAKIRVVHGSPEVGSLFGPRKSFSRLELEGVSISQSQIADVLLGKVGGENFRVARISVKQLVLDGPLKLPALDVDAAVSGDGTLQTVKLTGNDKLVVTLQPKGGDIGFEIAAASMTVPFVPALTLADFGMKGTATRAGVTGSEFDGRTLDGTVSGTARIRWGDGWTVDGELRARGLKVAVFAPALVSEGKVEGRAAYTMSGPAPATLFEHARIQGEFKIEKGVLGSFDLARALQSGGANTAGRTIFNEMNGQGMYDKGTVQISNASINAGALNAGVGLNVDAGGGLSGRIVAELKTPNQTQRATLSISGKIQEPVIRK